MSRQQFFWLINICVVACGIAGALLHPYLAVRAPFVLLLFLLCSLPLLAIRDFNDRYLLLGLFSAVYFLYFGTADFTALVLGSADGLPIQARLTQTDGVILTGIAVAHLAYRLVCGFRSRGAASELRDWPETLLAIVGAGLWIACTYLSWQFQIHVVNDVTTEAVTQGLASISGLTTIMYVLAAYMQPFGILILSYAQTKYQRAYLLPLLIAVVLGQMVYGFIIDVKGMTLLGMVLVILTKMLMNGRMPKSWVVGAVVFVGLAFPVMQANRAVRGEYGTNRTEAASNIITVLQRAIESRKEVNTGSQRAETFFERMSLYGSVDMIVSKTGSEVPYQNGYTLYPLLAVYVPRLILPTKLDVQTGQLMNKVFHISDQEYTYISPSHLGELYWNFGWSGVIVGMFVIGALLGLIGSNFDLTAGVTMTRVLMVMATIKFIVLGFEGSITSQYSVWLRCLPIIGFLHLLFARIGTTTAAAEQNAPPHEQPLAFHNLMR